jgi:hypothetical protein
MHSRSAELSFIAQALETVSVKDVVRNEAGAIIGITERRTDTASLIARGQNLVRGMKARHEYVPDHEEWLGTAARFLRAWALHDTGRHDELVTFAAGLEGIAAAMTDHRTDYGSAMAPSRLLTGWVDEPLN